VGHKLVVNRVHELAQGGDYWIFLSHTQDAKKNPLTWDQKIKFARLQMPSHAAHFVQDAQVKTPLQAMNWLYDQGYDHVTMVVGSDRVHVMQDLLDAWNSEPVRQKDGRKPIHVKVMSAGERDPDSDGVEGMSASLVRSWAQQGDFDSFAQAVNLDATHAKEMYDLVRENLKTKNLSEAAPLLVGGAAALLRLVPNLGRALGIMAKNPVKTTAVGVAAAHPEQTAELVKGTVNFISNPGLAIKQMASDALYTTVDAAVQGINQLTGGKLDAAAVKALAELAVKSALPVAAVVAVLWGGKKLYDYFTKQAPVELEPLAKQITEHMMRESDHAHGTIIMMKLNATSVKQLRAWAQANNVPCLQPSHMHVSVIMSPDPAPELMQLDQVHTHVTAQPDHWRMLGNSTLALVIKSEQIDHLHDQLQSKGVSHSHADFVPHVSMCYTWKPDQPMPVSVPDFGLTFDQIEVDAIDPDFGKKSQPKSV
jgi:hypothetical protein